MEQVSIKTGNLEVIAAGQVIVLSEEVTTLEVQGIKLLFKFENDDRDKPHVEAKSSESANTLNVTFWNFNNSLGLGNTEPLEIATTNNKKLFFSYRIFTLDDKKLRTLEYTFYTG